MLLTRSLGVAGVLLLGFVLDRQPPMPSGMRVVARTRPSRSSTHPSWWCSAQSMPTKIIGLVSLLAGGWTRASLGGRRRARGPALERRRVIPPAVGHLPPTSRGTNEHQDSTASCRQEAHQLAASQQDPTQTPPQAH